MLWLQVEKQNGKCSTNAFTVYLLHFIYTTTVADFFLQKQLGKKHSEVRFRKVRNLLKVIQEQWEVNPGCKT